MFLWKGRCEDRECSPQHITLVQYAAYLDTVLVVMTGRGEGYNSIPITLVGTVLPPSLLAG